MLLNTLSISTYAVNALSDVVFIKLPQTDIKVGFRDAIKVVKLVKSTLDILTLVSGIVTETNNILEDKLSAINQDLEGDA